VKSRGLNCVTSGCKDRTRFIVTLYLFFLIFCIHHYLHIIPAEYMRFNTILIISHTVLYVKDVRDLRTSSLSVMASIYAKKYSVCPPYERIEILTAVTMRNDVLLVVMPSILINAYQSFGGTYCLHLQCRGLGRAEKRHDM